MKTNAPKSMTLWIAVILVIIALIGHFVAIPFVTVWQFWILFAGFVVLLIGNLFKGL